MNVGKFLLGLGSLIGMLFYWYLVPYTLLQILVLATTLGAVVGLGFLFIVTTIIGLYLTLFAATLLIFLAFE